jgi:hypothetical protein
VKKGKTTISQYEIQYDRWKARNGFEDHSAHICIVVAFPVHYSIDLRLSVIWVKNV